MRTRRDLRAAGVLGAAGADEHLPHGRPGGLQLQRQRRLHHRLDGRHGTRVQAPQPHEGRHRRHRVVRTGDRDQPAVRHAEQPRPVCGQQIRGAERQRRRHRPPCGRSHRGERLRRLDQTGVHAEQREQVRNLHLRHHPVRRPFFVGHAPFLSGPQDHDAHLSDQSEDHGQVQGPRHAGLQLPGHGIRPLLAGFAARRRPLYP